MPNGFDYRCTVSVLIPVRERERYGLSFLPLACANLLRQQYADFEAVFVLPAGVRDPYTRIFEAMNHAEEILDRGGMVRAFAFSVAAPPPPAADTATAIADALASAREKARGRLLVRMDDDDWYGPAYLSQVAHAATRQDYGCGASVLVYNVRTRHFCPPEAWVGGGLQWCTARAAEIVRPWPRPAPGQKDPGEDTAWLRALGAIGVDPTKHLLPRADAIVLRWGEGHTWPAGNDLARVQDRDGELLRERVGDRLAAILLSLADEGHL